VESPSIIAEFSVVVKSIETSGSLLYWIIPFISPASAFLNTSFTSSTVTAFSTSTTKSTNETFGVGTRSAIPCNFPSRWGSTMPSAFAAPVEVGIIDWVHPRALRKSLRSEEHTSELQSRFDLVCRLLLEKKKDNRNKN